MSGNIEAIGEIFFPDDPTNIIAGAMLVYEPLSDPSIEFNCDIEQLEDFIEIILGNFTGIGKVTLFRCRNAQISKGYGGVKYKYKSEFLFTGQHFNSEDELSFQKVSFEFSFLRDWLNLSCIDFAREEEVDIYRVKHPEKIYFEIPGEIKASFNVGYRTSHGRNKVEIWEKGYLNLDFESDISFKRIFELEKEFKNFFALIINENIAPKRRILVNNQRADYIEVKGKVIYLPIEAYSKNEVKQQSKSFLQLYLEFKDLKNQLNEIMNNWFSGEELKQVINLATTQVYIPEIDLVSNFLNFCFALETYHRRFVNNEKFPASEFEQRLDYLDEKIENPSIKKWVKEKVKYGNEPSFRNRLKDLKKYISLATSAEPKDFIDSIVISRNYYVHYGKKDKKVLTSASLFYLVKELELILKLMVYDRLGISQETLTSKLETIKKEIDHRKKEND